MKSKKIAIIGAGFSGLTLAWALTKKNIQVEIFEAKSEPGGAIQNIEGPVVVESAANAILANVNVENLLNDLSIKILVAGYRSKKRWIFRNKAREIPLNFFEILNGISNIIFHFLSSSLKPQPLETIEEWCERCLNKSFARYVFSPGLQGIYGTSVENLSAELIFSVMKDKNLKTKKGQLKGSIAPQNGMSELIFKLSENLKIKGVVFNYNIKAQLTDLNQSYAAVIVAVSHQEAVEVLSAVAPRLSQNLKQIPSVDLTSVTLGFQHPKSLRGFGCLFAPDQDFNSLGVLFNTDIFANRGSIETETWITNRSTVDTQSIIKNTLSDRKKLLNSDEAPILQKISQHKKVLPVYGVQLYKFLNAGFFNEQNHLETLLKGARVKSSDQPLYLTGNYLGVIGLARILDYNVRLAERIDSEIIQ